MTALVLASRSLAQRLLTRLAAFWSLCKPRVNSLIVFTAVIGMLLAPGGPAPAGRLLVATLGIALVAFSAAAINCLLERTVDARMARTRARPLPRRQLHPGEALALALLLGGAGLWLLHKHVNDLTMTLTLATFLGYAVVYTLLLKPATPMNIVIGGASGAMPPVLGWTAMTGHLGPEPLALFLIVFLWTPPHFWALAMARRDEYAQAGFPMLPVTHGIAFTCRHSRLYVVLLTAASFLPIALGMAGIAYGLVVAGLNAVFLGLAGRLCRDYSDALARQTFRWSVVYLASLFAALFADRLLAPWLPSL